MPSFTPLWFIVTGRNCSHTVRTCLDSLLQQSSGAWRCVVVDDGSGDGTFELAREYARAHPERILALRNETRLHKAVSFVNALGLVPDDGIVAELDLDDELSSTSAVDDLLRLHAHYDVVWTQHATVNHTMRPWTTWRSTPLPAGWTRRVPEDDRVWSASYFPGHLRTFKKYLFDAIDSRTFLFEREPLLVAFDMVYYTAIVELAPDPLVCFYDRPIHRYHVWPHNDDFLEIDTRSAGLHASSRRLCQSEMDRWFKRLPVLTPLSVSASVRTDGEATVATRTVHTPAGLKTLRYTFSKTDPDWLAERVEQRVIRCMAECAPL